MNYFNSEIDRLDYLLLKCFNLPLNIINNRINFTNDKFEVVINFNLLSNEIHIGSSNSFEKTYTSFTEHNYHDKLKIIDKDRNADMALISEMCDLIESNLLLYS